MTEERTSRPVFPGARWRVDWSWFLREDGTFTLVNRAGLSLQAAFDESEYHRLGKLSETIPVPICLAQGEGEPKALWFWLEDRLITVPVEEQFELPDGTRVPDEDVVEVVERQIRALPEDALQAVREELFEVAPVRERHWLPTRVFQGIRDVLIGLLRGTRPDPETHWQDSGRPKIPWEVRKAVLERDQRRCRACGSTENLEFDHVFPYWAGGDESVGNLQLLCHSCNVAKGGSL